MNINKKPGAGRRRVDSAIQENLKTASYCGDARLEFLSAIRAAGIAVAEPDAIVADGEIHRFHVEGDKHGTCNGWSVLFADSHCAGGAFGSWRANIHGTWHSGRKSTGIDHRRLAAAIEDAEHQRDAEKHARVLGAQRRAAGLWSQACAADPSHPYLVRKRVKPHGILQIDDKLVIPARDAEGTLWTLQFIYPDGEKRFLAGGAKRGHYFAIGEVVNELLIAEGFATAASIHEATGKPVAVAFDAGNLESVARVLRAKFPIVRITIAADNDVSTVGNPGLSRAMAAARAVDGYVAVPPDGFNDFNDAAIAGMEVVR